MTKQDLKQIQKLFRFELQTELPIQLGKFADDVLLPAAEDLMDHKAEQKIRPIKKDIGVLKTRYPDKDYLDDKTNELRGDIMAGRKKDSARVDKHIEFHHRKDSLTDQEVEELEQMRDFAPLPVKA